MTHKYTVLLFSLAIALFGCQSNSPTSKNQFFDNLRQLCGAQFVGEMTFPEKGQDSFAGKVLTASFEHCDETQIKIPFAVGEDTSRTWLITQNSQGLQLKHDHRHADGTPDEINMYGGMTLDAGEALSQSFAADQHTAQIIPAASTNVWTLSLTNDKQTLTYYLERNAAPRFKAVLRRKQ